MTKATDVQVGGDHYKDMPIQPVEYIHANKLTFLEGNVVKYITRHRAKNGRKDVEKALHYCQLILQLDYGDKGEPEKERTHACIRCLRDIPDSNPDALCEACVRVSQRLGANQ